MCLSDADDALTALNNHIDDDTHVTYTRYIVDTRNTESLQWLGPRTFLGRPSTRSEFCYIGIICTL